MDLARLRRGPITSLSRSPIGDYRIEIVIGRVGAPRGNLPGCAIRLRERVPAQ